MYGPKGLFPQKLEEKNTKEVALKNIIKYVKSLSRKGYKFSEDIMGFFVISLNYFMFQIYDNLVIRQKIHSENLPPLPNKQKD